MAVAEYTEWLGVPDSSNIAAVAYNDNHRVLWIEFLSGSIIGYRNVPRSVFNGFQDTVRNGGSVGKFYNANVRQHFHGLGVEVDAFDKVSRNDEFAAVKQANKFVVKGQALIVKNITANSWEEAVQKFLHDNPGATVTEVTAKFD